MLQFRATITEIETFPGQLAVSWRAAEARRPHPGQYYLALPPAGAPTPLFPGRSAEAWLLPAGHPLATLAPGDTLSLLGPCGAVWEPRPDQNVLVIGDQPEKLLFVLARALAARCSVTWWWRAAVPEWAPRLLPPAVELQRGPLTQELARWAEVLVADGPPEGVARLARRLRELGGPKPAAFAHAFLTPPMPCGVGACLACWAEGARGRRLACVDGPLMVIG